MTVPDWKAERYLLGELPESEMSVLRALDCENGEFHAMLERLRRGGEELLAKHSAKAAAERMLEGARKFAVAEPARNRWLVPISACAAVLLCSALLLSVAGGDDAVDGGAVVVSEDGERVKGLKAGLEIWRKTADSVERLSDNSVARAGDLLQIRYVVPERCYGVLLSLDGNGVLTIHLSGERGMAAQLEAGRTISLKNAYELDDAQKFETFYLLTADREFELAPVTENILGGKLPRNLKAAQVTLKKK